MNKNGIALNPNTPVETLIKLSRDENWPVRKCVAKNPNTPTGILVELGRDENKDVCTFVERNQKSKTEKFKKLKMAYKTLNE